MASNFKAQTKIIIICYSSSFQLKTRAAKIFVIHHDTSNMSKFCSDQYIIQIKQYSNSAKCKNLKQL